ncbi:helix-turn-helix transcriptional regulator [Paenibacillus marchantiae]|uniref:helix-turn-helix domain-containing protein n=1 Tax=Paenibacillus marchantiae TaxID=3026433 RepID=UPI00237A0B6F|nr:helix-turn-helix transcriptional regulator [Paenibacillus marchantiae]WDQ34975.1 helix-turn-helix transcriptional regulator [Paenibacillus marchantiae]
MTVAVDEQQQLKALIRQYIDEERNVEKLVDYLSRHEVVGLEVFAYLGFDKMDGHLFQSVAKDVFIRRIPFYFHHSQGNLDNLGTLYNFVIRIIEYSRISYEEELERFYIALEQLYHDYRIDTVTIFNYTIRQTGYVGEFESIYTWLHYLELARKLGVEEKTPKHLIVDYNIVRERAGLKPIIYEIRDMYVGDYIERNGNILKMEGIFPCDRNNQPILKWIGLRIKNAKRIWVDVNDRLKGFLYVEITPKTKVWGLNAYGEAEDGSDVWYDLYTGPLLMEFDYTVIKDKRVAIKMTQKQLAEAIGASDRTLQKWERGETTPDGHFLLRLMNVLDIKELSEITKIQDVNDI